MEAKAISSRRRDARTPLITRTRLRIVVLMILALVVSLSAGSDVTAAIGDNAVYLPGVRPGNPLNPSGYVEVPYSTDLNPSGGDITIEAWVKRNGEARNETIVGNGWETSYWFGFSSSGHLRFIPHGSGSMVDSNNIVPAGVWTHVAVAYDGSIRRYYINGVLDTFTAEKSGLLAPAPAGQSLGIGFDVDDTFSPNYFGGWIDTVRIWNTARDAQEIEAGMFQSYSTARSDLLAVWPFDGDAGDPVGGHDGIAQGNVTFGNEGALPHDIRIPQVSTTPSLDGFCDTGSEYANATQVTVDGTGVWLMHTADDMWVCFDDLRAENASASVYLDAGYTRVDPAQPEHLLLRVNEDGSTEAKAGVGDGSYADTTAADGKWDATYQVCCGEFPTYRAEFRISSDLVQGWSHVMGLALSKFTGTRGGLDIWPALAGSTQPSTWSSAILGGVGDPRTFSGRVIYQPQDSTADPVGIAGVTVDLIGSDPNGGEALAASVESALDGSFSLTTTDDFTLHRLELGAPPKGFLAEDAEADAPGVAVDARTINYGTAPGGTYANNVFTLDDALPYVVDGLNGPYFLIVAPQYIVDSGALDEFVDYKRRLGFTVEVATIESIASSTSGATLKDKVRTYEQSRLAAVGNRFQYVMLVGPHSVIPVGFVTPWFNGKDGNGFTDLDACLAAPMNSNSNAEGVKIKLTDWYYADLTSNFDSNGNGCLLDGIKGDPNKFASGYTPDTKPAFSPTVAVGRIPFATESAVRTALTNSMRFEQRAPAFKQQTLQAMSNAFLEGQHWTPVDSLDGSYEPCPGGVNKNCKGTTTDAAYVAERTTGDFLNALSYANTTLYESAKPPGASPATSTEPLTGQNVLDQLEGNYFGFVGMAGHGWSGGIARTYWSNTNTNNTVDSPTEPAPFTSLDEISSATLISKNGLSTLTPDDDSGAIYAMAACSTGNPLNENNIGATLLEDGHGVAWIGAYSMVNVGPWTQPSDDNMFGIQYHVTEKLLNRYLRLGDAVWQTLGQQIITAFSGSAEVATALYGDPTLSYWGNPGGQSTLAAWPMLRFDPRGQGYTPLAGPEVPQKQWEYSANAPGMATLPPSPVVSNNGEVIVAHGSYVDVLRQGTLYERLQLDAAAFGTPAIAADGTIYALDVNGTLYAFPYKTKIVFPYPIPIPAGGATTQSTEANSLGRYRRWALPLGNSPRTSPVVGADGFIAVGTSGTVQLVRPDGVIHKQQSVPGEPIGAPAVGANRHVYVATSSGFVGEIDFFCPLGVCMIEHSASPGNSTPPLLAYGSVYVGATDGTVVKLATGGLAEQATFQADGIITAGPVAGPGGQVLVGTQNGTLYSLTENLTVRWQRSLGTPVDSVPAFSADALYVVNSSTLHAYHPFSGAPLWSRYLGIGTGDGSVAVGYGRELYLQTDNGTIFGYGEGWTNKVFAISSVVTQTTRGVKAIKVDWLSDAPPSGSTSTLATASTTGVLLQRRTDASPWEDVAVLPPGTTVYTDTKVADSTNYAYRVQLLDSEGNHSDFTTTMVEVQSLPALPQAPTLDEVAAVAADALALDWSSPAGDAVTGYRIERSAAPSGSFATVQTVSGQVTTATDEGLDPNTTYYYRVIATNAAGESAPSAVVSGTTRQQTLPTPQDVTATLLDDGQVQVSWSGAPVGATTVIEYTEGANATYQPLGSEDAAGPYSYYPGEPSTYVYRVKFVQGNTESAYAQTRVLLIAEEHRMYLPTVVKQ